MPLPARSATEPPARRGSTSRNRPLPTLVGEQSAVVGGAERVEVLPKDGYALGWDWDEPDLFRRTVLEPPVVMSLAGVRPLLSYAGTRPLGQHRPPASLGRPQDPHW
jgi:hypothetical protein